MNYFIVLQQKSTKINILMDFWIQLHILIYYGNFIFNEFISSYNKGKYIYNFNGSKSPVRMHLIILRTDLQNNCCLRFDFTFQKKKIQNLNQVSFQFAFAQSSGAQVLPYS